MLVSYRLLASFFILAFWLTVKHNFFLIMITVIVFVLLVPET